MGPIQQQAGNGVRARPAEDDRTAGAAGTKADRRFLSASGRSAGSSSETRLNERFARLLRQKKGPDAVIVAVLSVALVVGLLGFAVHFLWVVAIIVIALGLGFIVANSRRDRIDIVNQRAERRSDAQEPTARV